MYIYTMNEAQNITTMKLSELKASDMINGLPCDKATGTPRTDLQERHHASYLRQMNDKYGDMNIVLVNGSYVVVSNEKYLLKQAAHYAELQTPEYANSCAEFKARQSFNKGLTNKD
jgi:hypothetical protein